MNKIDTELENKLSLEDQHTLNEINQECDLFDLIRLSFSGNGAWLTYFMYLIGFAAFFAAVYLYVNFAASTDLKSSLAYAVGIFICVFILFTVKILGWQNMQRLELLREIKRVEMRLMLLAKQPPS